MKLGTSFFAAPPTFAEDCTAAMLGLVCGLVADPPLGELGSLVKLLKLFNRVVRADNRRYDFTKRVKLGVVFEGGSEFQVRGDGIY